MEGEKEGREVGMEGFLASRDEGQKETASLVLFLLLLFLSFPPTFLVLSSLSFNPSFPPSFLLALSFSPLSNIIHIPSSFLFHLSILPSLSSYPFRSFLFSFVPELSLSAFSTPSPPRSLPLSLSPSLSLHFPILPSPLSHPSPLPLLPPPPPVRQFVTPRLTPTRCKGNE